jgi:hypothetical protein
VGKNYHSNNLNQNETFGKKYKVLIDELAKKLWDGENHILKKKSERQYFIQKSKTHHFESHIYVVYRTNTLSLEYYEKSVGVETNYKKMYNISDITIDGQVRLAEDFANQVFVNGKIKF